MNRHAGISIPYGSIKRKASGLNTEADVISIPYGSIKRKIPLDSIIGNSLFQFLMVRLKVYSPTRSARLPLFQFLMVRLKDLPKGDWKSNVDYFNSLWFD